MNEWIYRNLHEKVSMLLKFSRGIWLFSILCALASLLFVYAGLPEEVVVSQQNEAFLYAHREVFFYSTLAVITLVNSMVFLVGSLFVQNIALRTWFNGLIVVLNLFFIISLFFISAINSNEKFDFPRIGFLIYGSVGLIAIWALSWPVYLLIQKISNKTTV